MFGRSVSLLGSTPTYNVACSRLQHLKCTRVCGRSTPRFPAGRGSRHCSTAKSQNGETAEPKHQAPKHEHEAEAAESGDVSPHKHHTDHHGHHDGAHGAAHQLQHRAAEKMTFQLLEKVTAYTCLGNLIITSHVISADTYLIIALHMISNRRLAHAHRIQAGVASHASTSPDSCPIHITRLLCCAP
jgi:hypothetical protein